ncbi:hypothetical protein SETIT_2G335700v2 [Setaria italica]|uniref:Uncharacterized protein n=1 Tax=Setaria italica TaxID=4555 RepID=A0A368Q7S3_SETIT|nr:hypothetical protein SETIT_2G335700v2 [Setaria italica]
MRVASRKNLAGTKQQTGGSGPAAGWPATWPRIARTAEQRAPGPPARSGGPCHAGPRAPSAAKRVSRHRGRGDRAGGRREGAF